VSASRFDRFTLGGIYPGSYRVESLVGSRAGVNVATRREIHDPAENEALVLSHLNF